MPENKPKKQNTDQKSLIPKAIHDATDKFLKAPSLIHSKDYQGNRKDEKMGQVEVWKKQNIEYLVKSIDYVNKFESRPPKISVSQDKNIKLLIAMVENQQLGKKNKKAECSFTLKEYAKLRGFSDEEIKRGGIFFDELKMDLKSGAYCVYSVPVQKEDGLYIIHGSFYTIEEPKERKRKWIVKFNASYADSILEVLNKQSKQYFAHYLKEIADKETTKKPYLHYFYNQLVYRRVTTGCTMPKKVIHLLEDMGSSEDTLKRQNKCYEILKECLIYISSKYPEELNKVILQNSQETKGKPLILTKTHFDILKKSDYKKFKIFLKTIGQTDIRECYISFCGEENQKNQKSTPEIKENHRNQKPEEQTQKLIKDILKWIYDWQKVNKYPLKKTDQEIIKFLSDSIRLLGYETVNKLLKDQNYSNNPSAFNFIFKILPHEIKKQNKN